MSAPAPVTTSLVARLVAHFVAHPNIWVDWRTCASIAGGAAWRTRISDARRAPWNLRIENVQWRVENADGTTYTESRYRYVPEAKTITGTPSPDATVGAR